MSPRVGGTFDNAKAAGEAIERQAAVILNELDSTLREAIESDLLPLLRAGTPVAEAGSLNKRSLAKYEGELRDAWASIPGAPRAGSETLIYNAAPHANLIEPGRRRRSGRIVGSSQAPKGITRPALKRLEGAEESATARVVAEVERRLG